MLVRVAIACLTFLAGVCLTTFSHLVSRRASPPLEIQISELERADTEAEAELRQIFEEYGPAQTRHDVAFFERVEAEEFMLFSQQGQAMTRTQDIEWMKSEGPGITYQNSVHSIKFYGNSAVVTSQMIARFDETASVSWPTLNICVKRNGHWQILSSTNLDHVSQH
jgi:hypothetical protein